MAAYSRHSDVAWCSVKPARASAKEILRRRTEVLRTCLAKNVAIPSLVNNDEYLSEMDHENILLSLSQNNRTEKCFLKLHDKTNQLRLKTTRRNYDKAACDLERPPQSDGTLLQAKAV